ncbi:MAG: hypothetical protein IT258_19775 [Saprospiraceae bacterium]|nr:hypothetical protein [Saprospiraceae bacterium]
MFNPFNRSTKHIDKEAVKAAALQLLSENGATTTLEVKNNLRSNHYIATQSEVSDLLDEIAGEEGWQFQWNGKFRVYFIAQPQDLAAAFGVPAFSAN